MIDPNFEASDPLTANHHWFPFLRYKKDCEEAGKEVTVDGWLRLSGRLAARVEFEKSKELAEKEAQEKATAAAEKASAKKAAEQKATAEEKVNQEKTISKK